jgi:anti-sigma factor RsiW
MSPWRRPRHAVADRPLTCREVGKLLQRYLDDETDEHTTTRVAEHLEDCRRCGLEATIYREIKASLARQAPTLPETTLASLRRFGEHLAAAGAPDDNGHDDGDSTDDAQS